MGQSQGDPVSYRRQSERLTMSLNFGAWRKSNLTAQDAVVLRTSAAAMIARNPTSIVLYRDGSSLTAQTFRVEVDDTVREMEGDDRQVTQQRMVLFGTDERNIARGDRFWLNDSEYEVSEVIRTTGQVQAIGERRNG